jgi:hypothetical protein
VQPSRVVGLRGPRIVSFLVVFCCLPLSAASGQSLNERVAAQPLPYTMVQGIYRNYTYGFEVKIPKGLVGLANPPGSPDHGLEIPLEVLHTTGINIFASYNALQRESAKEVWETDELHAIEDSSAGTRVLTENAVRLCGWNSIQAVVEYTRDSRSPLRKDEVVVALDHSPDEASRESVGRVYILRLQSTSDRFNNDRKWFEEVVKSFQCFDAK